MGILKDRMDQLERIADKAMLDQLQSAKRITDAMQEELRRRGYDVDGKSIDEIEDLVKSPPTLAAKP